MNIVKNVIELIGKTPLISLQNIAKSVQGNIFVKLESRNPGGSIKDRLALALIEDAENKGLLNNFSTIIEPTSGNTGIGLAMICAIKNYHLIIVMPESMSVERRKLIAMYGAKIVLTPANLGMKGAIEKANSLKNEIPNSYIPQQFENQANVEIHKRTTAEEIWNDTNGKIDIFVAGVGTGGTLTGVGEVLKQRKPDILIAAVEPDISAVLSGKSHSPHKIQGIGAGFIPSILKKSIIDKIITVSADEAMETARQMAKKEGILCGISSGANVFAAMQLSKIFPNQNIVTILPDTGERYLSTSLFNENV